MRIEMTGDGSRTLVHDELGVPYHSLYGAVSESLHVFIENGLHYYPDNTIEEIKILEVGFGTGLNALLTYIEISDAGSGCFYTGIDPAPPAIKLVESLDYPEMLDIPSLRQIVRQMQGADSSPIALSPKFKFQLIRERVQEAHLPHSVDLVYYDAFAPGAQPEMWQTDVLQLIRDSMVKGGVLVTYCAQGQFRRNLMAAGFEPERIPGPPGKREMIRAIAI